MKTLSIDARGVMLSCYFDGTAGVMLVVCLDQNTTVNEVLEGLESEIQTMWESIEFCAEAQEYTGDLAEALKAQLDEMRDHIATTGNGEKPFHKDLDYSFDDEDLGDELPVAIFSVEFKEAL